MSDINTPAEGEHPEERAESRADRPPEEMSSYNIEPPPTEDAEIPGVPDESGALGAAEHGPGSNATGVGS